MDEGLARDFEIGRSPPTPNSLVDNSVFREDYLQSLSPFCPLRSLTLSLNLRQFEADSFPGDGIPVGRSARSSGRSENPSTHRGPQSFNIKTSKVKDMLCTEGCTRIIKNLRVNSASQLRLAAATRCVQTIAYNFTQVSTTSLDSMAVVALPADPTENWNQV